MPILEYNCFINSLLGSVFPMVFLFKPIAFSSNLSIFPNISNLTTNLIHYN